ncbi:MAG: apolipoprotein N-acyltransferase [bacterium]|nr:MAG: apolipoprotein N-acyltransferase [bacterium]KAF0147976.1 MAG: apolipoprotein N-acyltransferase [bacterium]KAF0167514.1 MAG: apolipoprotein N-acyltransferase [bacterium]TXT17253.1 MAG: apolipoprotein N-acyltransferase [bacterium]
MYARRFAPALAPLLSALLGALAVAGFAPLGWYPLSILSLAGLFHLARAATPWHAFLLGWSYGLGLFLAGVSWIYVSISTYGGMPVPLAVLATLLFCAFIALFPALALAAAARLATPGRGRVALALPAAWVLGEWLRGWIFTGFPWLALGYSQAPDSPLAGFAPVLGVYGVSLLAALSAGLIAAIVPRAGRVGQSRLPALAGLAVLWLAGLALHSVDWTRPTAAPVRVALLQGNIAQDLKFRPEKLEATLGHYARAVLASDARLIVLPETALPLFRSAVPRDYLDLLAEHARTRDGDIVLGIPEDAGPGRYYNSILTLGASPEGVYRKAHLVPFGEFVPFGFRWAVDLMSIPLGDFGRGDPDQPPLAAAGEKLAVNVCYEDAFGEERIAAARTSTLLVNVSNDAWFGESLAPWQHLQIGAMRSLEAGRWQLRANNTGITAILDDKGRVRAQLAPFIVGTLHGEARGRTGDTPYLVLGNWPAVLGALGLLALAWRLPARRQGLG